MPKLLDRGIGNVHQDIVGRDVDKSILHVLGMNEQFFVKKIQVLEKYRTHQSVEIGSGQKPHPGSPPQKWQKSLPSLLFSADKHDKSEDLPYALQRLQAGNHGNAFLSDCEKVHAGYCRETKETLSRLTGPKTPIPHSFSF